MAKTEKAAPDWERIEEACEQAGVIPLPWRSMTSLMATREAVARLMARVN